MDLSPVQISVGTAVAARQAGTRLSLQTAIMKQIADSAQQVAEMVQRIGLGQNIDLKV